MKFILATKNLGKLHEIQQILQDLPYPIITTEEFSMPDFEETGKTFIENAIIKARCVAKISGLPAIADDSGLCVDILHGAPGIYSARYAGHHADDQSNIEKLLFELRDIPENQRSAHFYCIIVLLRNADDPAPIICEGIWQGKILFEKQGNQGFGYDPIFYVPTHGCSAAELSQTEKNEISHRGQALKLLKENLFLQFPAY